MTFLKNYDKLMEEAGGGEGGGGATTLTDATTTTTAAATTTDATTTTDADNWLKGIDDEYAKDPSLSSIQDLSGLVKSYVHAQKLIGRDKVVIPDEYASDDDRSAFFDKIGRPQRDQYSVDFKESEFGDDFQKNFLDMAHAQGLMPKQAEAMFNFWNDQIDAADVETDTEDDQHRDDQIQGLKDEWGSGYEKNIATARQAVDTLVSDEFREYLTETGLGNDPQMIRMFAQIGNKLNEDTFSKDTVKHLGITKDEAKEKISTMMDNPEHAYWNKEHSGHTKAIEDMTRFNEIVMS